MSNNDTLVEESKVATHRDVRRRPDDGFVPVPGVRQARHLAGG